ncbi:MAG: ATP synthase F1 subunit delta [Solirubrobacterales bacterium]
MEGIARVYAEALFEAAKEKGNLDVVQEQVGQFADALDDNHDLQVFFYSPYFSTAEKQEGLEKAISGAEPEITNFLELLLEKHRMPALLRIRKRFDHLVAEENKELEVTVTSAVELDQGVASRIGAEIEKQTGRKVELTSNVDDAILGGLVVRVGNMVLDASVRNQLEKLRKSVATAA